MVHFLRPSDVLGKEPSAAQNGSVTKTCTQCGAINRAQVHRCSFCDASLTSTGTSADSTKDSRDSTPHAGTRVPGKTVLSDDWKRELEQRVETYRTRRKRARPDADQGAFPFEGGSIGESAPLRSTLRSPLRSGTRSRSIDGESSAPQRAIRSTRIALDDAVPGNALRGDPAEAAEEFAFAIGIGPRPHSDRDCWRDGSYRVEIDLTQPPQSSAEEKETSVGKRENVGRTRAGAAPRIGSPYFPLACLDARCFAGAIDAVFLLVAYGGFLTLFGSLGGHFSFSKFSAVVYIATLALFYVQYFALFTIFGGATPGMMLRHLELVNFDGERPTARQLLYRSFGYMVSGGTFLLGFFWALWDEDGLTWQDRISGTYLTSVAALLASDALNNEPTAEPANK